MSCICRAGAIKKSTKGRGKGFTCMRRISDAPRFMKKLAGGGCPRGAKMKDTKRGPRCMGTAPGFRFEAPVCR